MRVAFCAGYACTDCADGLVLGEGFQCSECPAAWVTVLAMVLCLLLLVLYMGYTIRKKKKGSAPKLLSVYLKICCSAFQQNSIALTYAFDWGELMQTYLSVQADVSSLGTAYLQVQCLRPSFGNTFVLETKLYLFAPLVLVSVVFLGSALYALGSRKHFNHPGKPHT